jgi:hypothetical protein
VASSDARVADAAQLAEARNAAPLQVPSEQDRRAEARQEIERRIVALEQEADRVLTGRDVSPGEMPVSASPHLTVWNDVKLAIHLPKGVPLTIRTKVQRDDGERGVVLRFHELPPSWSIHRLSPQVTRLLGY